MKRDDHDRSPLPFAGRTPLAGIKSSTEIPRAWAIAHYLTFRLADSRPPLMMSLLPLLREMDLNQRVATR